MSIDLDPKYESAYLEKVAVLYYQKDYDNCIKFAETSQKLFPKGIHFPWYKADCYSAKFQYENAIKALEEALKINPNNDSVIASIGWDYYYLQNYMKATEYAEKALKVNSKSNSAQNLKKALEKTKLPEGQRVVNFVRDYYLYYNKVQDFEGKSKEISAKQEVTVDEIKNYISSVRVKDDLYTFVVSGALYDELMKLEDTNRILSKELDASTFYIRINSFTQSTGYEFKKVLDSISKPEEKNLVIDLRDNSGGLAVPSNDILDFLLPECVTSNVIYRDGYSRPYYSDEGQTKFKKIIILVNENSASSSELLTLGLKKYLNNVVILGRPTVGKGVGQFTYEDKAKKYMIFLVNHYWNVIGVNLIHNTPKWQ